VAVDRSVSPIIPSDLYGPWEVEGYSVAIEFSDRARLIVSRDGARLKAVPPAVRESEQIGWIRVTLEAARKHHRDMKALLENAMAETIPLSAGDAAMLALDPVGRPLAEGLLVEAGGVVGRPALDDWALELLRGDHIALEPPFVVIHPVTLRARGTLEDWNDWLRRRWIKQPFKQIRREIYLPNVDDLTCRTFSKRFAGDVVRWDQARALLEGRGWYRVTKSAAERIYRRPKVTAYLEFRTPASAGFSRDDVVLSRVYFLPQGEQVRNRASPGVPVAEVAPIVFSETIRDASLVSQVAGR
jgi:hypothetical protein